MSKIIGKRPPTEKTPGILGQEYIDSTTGKTYVCTHVNYGAVNDEPAGEIEGRYTWEEGSGGGASSWNDLADKPFYEEAIKIDTFEWDGDTDGLVEVVAESTTDIFYRISDNIPTVDDVQNGVIIIDNTGQRKETTNEQISYHYNNFGVVVNWNWVFIVSPSDNYILNCDGGPIGGQLSFSKAGIYVRKIDANYPASITIPGYSGFENSSDTLTWDGNVDGLERAVIVHRWGLFQTSNLTPTIDDIQNGIIINRDDEELILPSDEILRNYDTYGVITDEFSNFCIIPSDNYELYLEDRRVTATFPKAGLYLYSDQYSGYHIKSIKIPGCNIFDGVGVKQLDPKYIKDMYYETKKTEYILENFNLGGTYHHGMGNMKCPLNPVANLNNLEDGQKCYLDFNGTIYEGMFISSGNPRMIFENVEFNGKTFPITVYTDDIAMSDAYMIDDTVWDTANISVYAEVVDVHGIDPKYLPDDKLNRRLLIQFNDTSKVLQTSGSSLYMSRVYTFDEVRTAIEKGDIAFGFTDGYVFSAVQTQIYNGNLFAEVIYMYGTTVYRSELCFANGSDHMNINGVWKCEFSAV